MARGRILDKSISESISFANLKDSNSQLLCCLLTSWWDDHGKMIGDEVWIKGNIVRKLRQFTVKEITRCLTNIHNNTDVQWWTDDNGDKWLYWAKFDTYQTISDDKRTKDKLPSPKIPKNPQESPGELRHNIREVKDKLNISIRGNVPLFWDYFLLKTQKAFKLTDDKRELIAKRLKEGYTLDELKRAVDAFVVDDWEGRKDHLDLVYCIGKQKGKPDNLEKWLNKQPKDDFDRKFRKES